MEKHLTSSPRRSSRNPLVRHFSQFNDEGTVTEAELVTPSLRRIRVESPALAERPYTPGQHVRMEINDPLSLYGILRPSQTLRTYTIWDHSADEGYFEIRVHLYDGEGIGLNWARTVEPGDKVVFWGPMGDFVVTDPPPFLLFVGEETASAAFGPMIRALPPGVDTHVVTQSESPDHDVPIPHPAAGTIRVHRSHRDGASPVSSADMVAAVAGTPLPDRPGRAYVAGEARTCQMVRDHLVKVRGWERTDIRTKPFWVPGKQGLH
ncbi:siderophore-interacting protein [Nocardiopsis aegyptia]|uniref:NADPH-dependent ferric siderophore reductase n=1 Tax=Nocardiopsis aegyptia TaxID=220378 RepID=A0A7Z0JBS3_9ACTN|nr:siderophore-interacting protein [Nocardiopsis aegyptia]NYJ35775.1 NADPH-dependent ferric siderophore reductase [Nocardiopsis aegyptia]